MRDLTPLLRPRSIAMIGASSDPSRGNGRVLRYLINGKFEGDLFAVNPRRTEIQGLRSWPSISQVPMAVDTVIVAVPADSVAAALRECAAAGTRAAIVFAGGFAESGEAGRAAQSELTQIARDANMLLLGPNSLGAYDARSRSFMTFSSMFEEGFASGGRIGMVSQSGGWGSEARRLAADRNLSILQWVSTGNEADLDAAEVLQAMAMDPDIDVILLYLEGVRDGERLRQALETARVRRKPVVAIKVGRTGAGQVAAASHTASLTGEDRVFDALCRHYGVHRADSLEELLDVAYAALQATRHGRMPANATTAILSGSGGFAVHMTDQAVQSGLQLPQPPVDVQRCILEMFPHASPRNPVDLTGQILNQVPDYGRSLELLLDGPQFAAADLFVGMAGAAPALREQWVTALETAAGKLPGKWLGLTVLAKPDVAKRYEDAGYAVFQDTARMLTAHAALVRMGNAFAREPADATAARLVQSWAGATETEVGAKQLLKSAGIGIPQETLCADAQAAATAAQAIGKPVAVKVVSADIPHKTEVGGVALNLQSPDTVRTAVLQMDQRVRSARPKARIDGYLVSPMAPDGVDCLVGLRHDPALGPVVLFGAGGVMAEWLNDVSIRLAPVSREQALAMISETRISRMLQGWRGAPPADVDALADAICALSSLSFGPEPAPDVEVNPLRVLAKGEGVLALDALITAAA